MFVSVTLTSLLFWPEFVEFVWNFPNQPSQLKATFECGEKLEKKIVDKCQQMDPRGTARHAHQLRLFLE